MRTLFQLGLLLLLATHSLSAGQAQGLTNPLLDPDFWPTATPEAVQTAINQGADVNARGEWDETPLHLAAGYNTNLEVIRLLVDLGADVNAGDIHYWTPLHRAAEFNNNAEIIRLLVQRGADVNAMDFHSGVPIHGAAAGNTIEVVRLLVQLGAELDIRPLAKVMIGQAQSCECQQSD